MSRQMVLGCEAVALGAIHAGISGAYSYPGTPATEIFESIHTQAKKQGIHAIWSTNEKVAYEEALGMSYAGKRALVSMKHVGLNVAADPFMNSGNTGANGGFVVAVADDPGMHSSQNEQDTRYFAQFAQLPLFEPANQQEAYDLTKLAFEFSEQIKLPVVLRLVTRLAHSRADIAPGEQRQQNSIHWPADSGPWTLLPTNARLALKDLVKKQELLQQFADTTPYNVLKLNHSNKALGIVAAGIAHNYVMENYPNPESTPSILKVSTYPMPVTKLKQLVDHVDTILVCEDGYPFIEGQIRGLFGYPGKKVIGRLSGHLPRTGELNPDFIWAALGNPSRIALQNPVGVIAPRPPALCKGCPHVDSYKALNEALATSGSSRVFSDIGCYTLGFYPPHNAIHSCVDMGASIAMAVGAANAGVRPSICAIGDSTFTHSGMTAIMDAIRQNAPITAIILDNETVAMTGFQPTMASGKKLYDLLIGFGADPAHVRIIEPLPKNHEENVRTLREELSYEGLSIILSQRLCVQLHGKKSE